MPYHPHPAAVLDLVGDWVPRWAPENPQLEHARAYLARVPAEFVASDFGLELHLQENRTDLGLSHPLTFDRHELLAGNLEALRQNLAPSAAWEALMAIARRTASLPEASRSLVDAISLCVDGAALSTFGCPALVYYNLARHIDRNVAPSPVCCPSIVTLVGALVEQPCAGDMELLWALERARRPSHRLAHLGLSFRTAPARLRCYVNGTVREHLELLAELSSAQWELVSVLQEIAAVAADRKATLFMVVREGRMEQLHVEFFPRKEHPAAASLLDLACDTAAFRSRVPEDRAATVRRLAARGIERVQSPGKIPISVKVSHIKATEQAGGPFRWKLYLVMRQGTFVDAAKAQR